MSADSVALQGRQLAESQMTSAGIVYRANGGFTTDPVTLEETPTYDTIYTGACRLRFTANTPRTGEVPGVVVTDQSATLSFPVLGSEGITTGDIWQCTANPLDPALVGRRLRIAGIHSMTHATARRFPVEETT